MADCKGCVMGTLAACNDFCALERRLLEDQAVTLAAAGGHTLGLFAKIAGEARWEARCESCDRPLLISLTLGPGEREIAGPALDAPCPLPAD